MPDMFNLLRQAQAMKQKMNEFQKELESQSFVGTAGKGAVTVTLNGKHDVLEVKISPEAAADVEKPAHGPRKKDGVQHYLSTAYQETFGYTVQEAILFGCKIMAPNRVCYPEMLASVNLYNHVEEPAHGPRKKDGVQQ